MPAEFLGALATMGMPVEGEALVNALPYEGFDPSAFRTRSAEVTLVVHEGDPIDLGDRHFEILHLPGHSGGCIGLWEAKTGTLFSGDAIYDGPLLDELPGSHIPTYVETMKRLRELPVGVVHGGHDESFGRDRLIEIADNYIRTRHMILKSDSPHRAVRRSPTKHHVAHVRLTRFLGQQRDET